MEETQIPEQKEQVSHQVTSFGEPDVGITAYASEGNEIKGITKYRIADFIVNEVCVDRTTLFPLEKEERAVVVQQPKNPETEPKMPQQSEYALSEETEATMKKLFGKEKAEILIKFYADLEAGSKPLGNEFSIQVDCPDDKEERGKVHGFVREGLRHMDSETIGDNAKKSIRIFFTKNKAKRGKTETKTYHAVLFKTGTDSYSALSNIGKFLRLPPRNFGSAGIKDKRGITTQLISITMNGGSAEVLSNRFQNARWNGMKVQQVKEAAQELRVGELYGNRFSIAIRLIDPANESAILQNVENLTNHGFINYFGMQRFGNNPKCHTHQIGQLILKKQWERVYEEIVGQETNDPRTNVAKSEYLKDKSQTKQALRDIQFKFKIERTLIQGYERAGMKSNYLTAICFLSRNMRNLYCHAYQSYIWNKLASERISRYGRKLVEGDLVAKRRDAFLVDFENEDDDAADAGAPNNDVDQIDEQGEPINSKGKYTGINDNQIEVIDASNIDKYTINDVLIPMVGSQLDIPQKFNLTSVLDNLLEADGVTKKVFSEISQNFFVQGGYRLLICQPEEVKYTLNRFNEKAQDILTPYYNVQEDTNIPEGKYAAICLKFTLFKGAYATMLIRELTRLPSDFDSQIKLNKQYEQLP